MRRKRLWLGLGLLIVLAGLAAAFWVIGPLPEPLFAHDYSTIVLDEEGRILESFLTGTSSGLCPMMAERSPAN